MFSILLAALATSAPAGDLAAITPAAQGHKPGHVRVHHGGRGVRHHRWGHRVNGRWHAGWRAPGGWAGYRIPVRGWTLPSYWINPGWRIVNYPVYALPAPVGGGYWTRYYDDAVMIDGSGRVVDHRSNLDWNRYEGGYAPDDADLDYNMGFHGNEESPGRPAYPGGPLPGEGGERGTYEGEWRGDYVDRRTYEGEWEGRYIGEDGRTYEGSYAGRMTGAPRGAGADYAPPPNEGPAEYRGREHREHREHHAAPPHGNGYGWQGQYGYGYGYGAAAYGTPYAGYAYYGYAPTTVVVTQGAPVTTTTVTEEYVYERAPVRRAVKKRHYKPKPKPRCIC